MARIRVLPVYPEFPESTFWSFKRSVRYLGKNAAMPPTGLATIAAMIPEDRFEVLRIVDLNVESLYDAQIAVSDLVFTSTMIVQQRSHDHVIERAHRLGKKVVAGGPFATTYPDRMKADYIVAGEAEVTLLPFLEDLLKGTNQRIWREEDVKERVNIPITKGGKAELTNTPLPRWDLLDLKKYASAAIQFSRGCPFDCDFCDITKLFGRESRTKSPEQMTAELDALYNSGYTKGSVFIVDDNFIGNAGKVRATLPHLVKWQEERGYPFTFYTEASANLAWDNNADILQGMNRAGFDFVFVGIESVDKDVLKKMSKGQNTVMSPLQAVRRIQQAGIEVSGGFIIGTDGEKPDAVESLFEFIQQAGIPTAMPGLLTAVRGTKLYDRLKAEGRIIEESDGNNTRGLGFNFETQIDQETLIRKHGELIEKLFDPRNYYARCKVLRNNLGPQVAHRKLDLEGVMAFGRSMQKQLFAKGGMEYGRYLWDTLVRKPSYLSTAVAQGIRHDHLGFMTKATLEASRYVSQIETYYEAFTREAEDFYQVHKNDMSKAQQKLSAFANQVVSKAEKKLARIHRDFRGRAETALNQLRERVQIKLNHYSVRNCGSKFD